MYDHHAVKINILCIYVSISNVWRFCNKFLKKKQQLTNVFSVYPVCWYIKVWYKPCQITLDRFFDGVFSKNVCKIH